MQRIIIILLCGLLAGCGGGVDDLTPEDDNVAPVANIYADPLSGPAPLTVTFTGIGVDLDGSVSFLWSFGDGQTSTIQNLSHTYTSPGTYTATLKVTDNHGATDTKTTTITVTQSLGPGHARSNPAIIGSSITYVKTGDYTYGDYSFQITLYQVLRGVEAWDKIKDANMFNDPPPAGYEYILADLGFSFLQSTISAQYYVYGSKFDAVSSNGVDYDSVYVVEPSPELDANLYAGGYTRGWAAFQIQTTDASPLLTFGRDYNGQNGIWFKLYP